MPADASFGFVTGGQAANTVSLAAARHHVLAEAGWDVEQRVCWAARRCAWSPPVSATPPSTGLCVSWDWAPAALEPVATGDQGAIDVADLAQVLASGPDGPTIVCLQAGNVNTGAFDDLAAATAEAHDHGAWVHVDGAFGLWAAASPATRHLDAGIETADSWATDGHKWLNVPYDSGTPSVPIRDAHAAAMSYTAAYLTGQGQAGLRAPGDYVLESSRRARGFATWAALRQLGRAGVAELVDRCCALARRFAEQLGADRRRHDRQRRRAQPGSRRVSATTTRDRPDRRGCATLGRVLDGRDDLARPTTHAHLGVELAHDRGRRRPFGRRNRASHRERLSVGRAHGGRPGTGRPSMTLT